MTRSDIEGCLAECLGDVCPDVFARRKEPWDDNEIMMRLRARMSNTARNTLACCQKVSVSWKLVQGEPALWCGVPNCNGAPTYKGDELIKQLRIACQIPVKIKAPEVTISVDDFD